MLLGFHPGQFHRLQGTHETGTGFRQRRKTETLIQVTHLTADIQANAPLALRLRHGHHRPGQKHFGGPAVLRCCGGAIPGTIPLVGILAFGGDLSVGERSTQTHTEPVAVSAFRGRIQGHAETVAREKVIARTQTLHQCFGGLLRLHADVQTLLRVEVAHQGLMLRYRQGVWYQHPHTVITGNSLPDGLIQSAVQHEVDGCLVELHHLDGGTLGETVGCEQELGGSSLNRQRGLICLGERSCGAEQEQADTQPDCQQH